MLSIRPAAEHDIPLIQNTAQGVWYRAYRFFITQEQLDYMFDKMYSTEALLEQMHSGHTFLLACNNNQPMAFASYTIADDTIKVPKLYVQHDLRRTGAGTALLDAVCAIGRVANCHTLQLNVNRYNSAQHFYMKYGMSVTEIVDIPYHTFVLNDYIMRKAL